MAVTTSTYDLRPVIVTPWATRAPRPPVTVRWHRVGRELCTFAGLLAFVACMVALRLSLYPQSIVSSRTAVLLTLVLGTAGVGLFFGAHKLHDAERR